jgi:hypothetical protein
MVFSPFESDNLSNDRNRLRAACQQLFPFAKLSDAEADECRKLWDDVAAVLKKAGEK